MVWEHSIVVWEHSIQVECEHLIWFCQGNHQSYNILPPYLLSCSTIETRSLYVLTSTPSNDVHVWGG